MLLVLFKFVDTSRHYTLNASEYIHRLSTAHCVVSTACGHVTNIIMFPTVHHLDYIPKLNLFPLSDKRGEHPTQARQKGLI
jgi:hypothetical protein